METLIKHKDAVNLWMERFGVKFGIYKHGVFNEQLFPFDSVPRVISHEEWTVLEKGLIQRCKALNSFLLDIYNEKKIVKDGVIPAEFVYSSKGYFVECEGITPAKGIFAHIAGIDLVQAKDGTWYILEDNLRIPSGASYPMIARNITRKVSRRHLPTIMWQTTVIIRNCLKRRWIMSRGGCRTVKCITSR